ncbi:hypothetical protein V1514DRAFT_302913 [Lipomyces japonicus]|uniref:uncharacterized protein n=1 Tax=Lipomyces japonicus TaxID=56871 RepID=UPI0034CEC9BD
MFLRVLNRTSNHVVQLRSTTRLPIAPTISRSLTSPLRYSSTTSANDEPFLAMPLLNTLYSAQSPYLRAHKDNPVAWQQWSDATLERARRENKPIFLSIGYHTCHWCHVMNDESFSSDKIAALLNERFIPIKLDREERPDIDSIYMLYLQAMSGGRGGWPLNVFLDPKTLNPIYGGTYWPGPWEDISDKTGRKVKPSGPEFRDVLNRIYELWTTEEQSCKHAGESAVAKLREWTNEKNKADSNSALGPGVLYDAYEYFLERYDKLHAGFGEAPKFPQPTMLRLLLRMHPYMRVTEKIDLKDEQKAADMAVTTLTNIAKGGIHDLIGNGFARYSVTDDWSLPHFEKMLYDQALLLRAYTDAYLFDKSNTVALDSIVDISTYLTSGPLAHANGGFYSAEDADSYPSDDPLKKKEGAFYVWTYDDFFKVLGRVPGDIAAAHWNVSEFGNVDPQFDLHNELEGQNVLQVRTEIDELSKIFGYPEAKITEILAECRAKLRAHREATRTAPSTDTKIVASWNGLAISALAKAAAACAERLPQESKVWLNVAEQTANFIYENLYDSETRTLTRVFSDGSASASLTHGIVEDYAFVISGLLDLYEATFNVNYLRFARELQDTQNDLFWDSSDFGYFPVPNDAKHLILRIKSSVDGAEPSANSVSVSNLQRLSAILDDAALETYANKTMDSFAMDIVSQPVAYSSLLESIVAASEGVRSIVLIVAPDAAKSIEQEFDGAVNSSLLTHSTVVKLRIPSQFPSESEVEEKLEEGWILQQNILYKNLIIQHAGKFVKDGHPDVTAYVCHHQTCELPITDADGLTRRIKELSSHSENKK